MILETYAEDIKRPRSGQLAGRENLSRASVTL